VKWFIAATGMRNLLSRNRCRCRRPGKRGRIAAATIGQMRAPRQSTAPFSPDRGSPIDSESSHHCRKDRGMLGRSQYSTTVIETPSPQWRGAMTYRLCYEDKTATGNDGALRIERFASESEALNRARALLEQNEDYTISILDDHGEIACGVRLQLMLGYRAD
jgi:hypothetical protein